MSDGNKLKYFNQLPFQDTLNFTHALSHIRITIAQLQEQNTHICLMQTIKLRERFELYYHKLSPINSKQKENN